MSIDSSIALQTKLPQFDNPLTQYAQIAAIQQAQQQNRLAELTYGDRQRETEQINALNSIYKGAVGADGTIDRNKLYTGAASGGLGSKIPGLQKGFAETDKAVAELAQSKSKTAEIDGKLALQRQEAIGNTLGAIAQIPGATPQHVVTGIQHLVDIGQIAPEMGQKIIGGIPQDPTQLKSWLEQGRNAVMKAADQMKFTTVDANTAANNRTSLATTGMNNATSLQTTGMNNATSLQTNGATNATSIRNTDAKIDAEKPPSGYRYNAAGNLEAIPGGPASGKQTDQQKTVTDANSVIGLLDMAEPLLKKATSSYTGTGVDKLAQAVGVSTDGAQATAQLKAIEGALVSKMPKMSGPQSDKDVLLYRQMAGQIGDSTVPVETRMAAAKVVRELNLKYIADNGGTPQAKVAAAVKNGEVTKLANARPVSVKTADDYAKLPSGAIYTAPDGSMRTKQ